MAGRIDDAAGDDLDALDGLVSLLDKSLVRQAEAARRRREPRIVMLETIREYATERLDAQPEFAAAAREAHARYFAELARARRRRPTATRSAELGNLRTAWRHWVGPATSRGSGSCEDALWPMLRGARLVPRDGRAHPATSSACSPTRRSTPERWQQEVTLRTSLARALPCSAATPARSRTPTSRRSRCSRSTAEAPQPPSRSSAAWPASTASAASSTRASRYAHEILRLADDQDDASMRVDGDDHPRRLHRVPGQTSRRDSPSSTRRSRAFESGGYRSRRLRLGNDLARRCLTTSGFFLWLLGCPDRAVDRADRAVALAQRARPSVLARLRAATTPGSCTSGGASRSSSRSRAERLGVAETNDLPIWRALGTCLLGAATSALGRPEGGPRPDRRRARPVPGPADAAGVLAVHPLHPGRGSRRGRDRRKPASA